MIQPAKKRKPATKRRSIPTFAQRGQRALTRAARKVAAENKRLGLPLVLSRVDDR
jgi:hypothetical protein